MALRLSRHCEPPGGRGAPPDDRLREAIHSTRRGYATPALGSLPPCGGEVEREVTTRTARSLKDVAGSAAFADRLRRHDPDQRCRSIATKNDAWHLTKDGTPPSK